MAKSNITKPQKRSSAKIQHKFVGIRETLVTDSISKAVIVATSNSSGTANLVVPISPVGLTSSVLASGVYTAGTAANVEPPHLLWLGSQATNFDYYRITNPRLVITGAQGSTTSGTVNVFTTRDMSDLGSTAGLQTAYVGSSGRTFDLASLANKAVTIPMVSDTSWKKVSMMLNVPGNSPQFRSGTSGMLVNVNSANDLCFTGFSLQVLSAPANTTVLTLQMVYDVEFRDPLNVALNL